MHQVSKSESYANKFDNYCLRNFLFEKLIENHMQENQ